VRRSLGADSRGVDRVLATADDWTISPITLRTGCSIGAGAVVVAGVEVGPWSTVGAGAIVTRNVTGNMVLNQCGVFSGTMMKSPFATGRAEPPSIAVPVRFSALVRFSLTSLPPVTRVAEPSIT